MLLCFTLVITTIEKPKTSNKMTTVFDHAFCIVIGTKALTFLNKRQSAGVSQQAWPSCWLTLFMCVWLNPFIFLTECLSPLYIKRKIIQLKCLFYSFLFHLVGNIYQLSNLNEGTFLDGHCKVMFLHSGIPKLNYGDFVIFLSIWCQAMCLNTTSGF